MRVGDSHGQRVGCVGAGDFGPRQQHRDHRRDLFLIRAARADDRLLNFARRVFVHVQPRRTARRQYRAARLCQFKRGLRVLVEKDLLMT